MTRELIWLVAWLLIGGTIAVQIVAARKARPAPLVGLQSVNDVVTLLGALASFLVAIGPVYKTFSDDRLQDLKAKLTSAEAQRDGMRDTVRTMLHFELRTWRALPTQPIPDPAVEQRLDDRASSGACQRPAAPLVFDGSGPATLECTTEGTLRLKLPAHSRLLLVPGP